MEKLTLKELAPYLPYNLMVLNLHTNLTYNLTGRVIDRVANLNESHKPILRNISDLTIENMKDFSGGNFKRYSEDFLHSILETYKRDIKTQKISYNLMQPLIENHFDVFNLLDKNLAVPVTENFNPYK